MKNSTTGKCPNCGSIDIPSGWTYCSRRCERRYNTRRHHQRKQAEVNGTQLELMPAKKSAHPHGRFCNCRDCYGEREAARLAQARATLEGIGFREVTG